MEDPAKDLADTLQWLALMLHTVYHRKTVSLYECEHYTCQTALTALKKWGGKNV